MDIFYATLTQMLVMFSFILIGFLFRKAHTFPEDAHTVLAKAEACILVPALNFSAWIKSCTISTFKENASLILYGFGLTLLALLVSAICSRLFVKDISTPEKQYRRQVYQYAMAFCNWGFLGNYIILSIWGDERFFQYSMFGLMINFIGNSWGIAVLTPKGQNEKPSIKTSLKRIFSPTVIGLLAGCVVGITGLAKYLPKFLVSASENAGNCMGPIAMLLVGFVVGDYDLKELLRDKKIYVATFLRLILIPAFFVSLLKLIGASELIQTLALIAFGTPFGLNSIVYPTAFGADTKPGASMAMISHTLSVITIPLMYLVFIVLL